MSFDLPTAVLCLAAAGASSAAVTQSAPPAPPTVLTDVRLADDPDAPRVGIVIEAGRIVQILDDGVPAPPGHRLIEGRGALALPAFLDACTYSGCVAPEPVTDGDRSPSTVANVMIGMQEANRKGLQPSFRAVEELDLSDELLAAYRAEGFAVAHSAPSGQLLGGTSTVATLQAAAVRDRVLVSDAFQSASFEAAGSGYPRTLMGRIAHLRQFFMDARWHAERQERYAARRVDRRPPYDPDLDAIQAVLHGERRLLCSANSARDIRRWLDLAEVWSFDPVICGGREAWRLDTVLAAAGVPVILGLDCGEEVPDPDLEPDELEESGDEEESGVEPDWVYQEPLAVQRDRRRRWEEARDCALQLHQAGVTFTFGSIDASPSELLGRVRLQVEAGLPEDVALAAMTSTAAELLGVGGHVGRIEVGYDANIALWSDSPFEKTAHLEWLVVDGVAHEFEHEEGESGMPEEGTDLTGVWEISYEEREGAASRLELDMAPDGSVRGTLTFTTADGEESHSDVTGGVSGRTLILEATVELGGLTARIRFVATTEGDGMSGDATWKYSGGEDTSSFSGTRTPPDEADTNGEKMRSAR
jgi:hypothetical protein